MSTVSCVVPQEPLSSIPYVIALESTELSHLLFALKCYVNYFDFLYIFFLLKYKSGVNFSQNSLSSGYSAAQTRKRRIPILPHAFAFSWESYLNDCAHLLKHISRLVEIIIRELSGGEQEPLKRPVNNGLYDSLYKVSRNFAFAHRNRHTLARILCRITRIPWVKVAPRLSEDIITLNYYISLHSPKYHKQYRCHRYSCIISAFSLFFSKLLTVSCALFENTYICIACLLSFDALPFVILCKFNIILSVFFFFLSEMNVK